MTNTRTELLKLLFEEWTKARPHYKIFCKDGILVNDEWDKQCPKIMFLLKETYTGFPEIIGRPHGPGGTSGTFWRRMRMWTYIIAEMFNNNTPIFQEAIKIKEEPNSKIAYLNIKKNVERIENRNDAYSNDDDIRKYAKNDKDFLKQQIEIIAPDIILCCGTFKFCSDIFDQIENLSKNLHKASNVLLIDFGHPSQRKKYEKNHNDLVEILSGKNWATLPRTKK